MLLSRIRLKRRRVTEVFGPSAEVRAKVVETLTEMTTSVRTYLIWRTVINIVLAILVGWFSPSFRLTITFSGEFSLLNIRALSLGPKGMI